MTSLALRTFFSAATWVALFTLACSPVVAAPKHALRTLNGFVPMFQNERANNQNIRVAPSEEYYIAGQGPIVVKNLKTGVILRYLDCGVMGVYHPSISKDSAYVRTTCGDRDDKRWVWNAKTGEITKGIPDDAFPPDPAPIFTGHEPVLAADLKSKIRRSLWTAAKMPEPFDEAGDTNFREVFDDAYRYISVELFQHGNNIDLSLIQVWDTLSGTLIADVDVHKICGEHLLESVALSGENLIIGFKPSEGANFAQFKIHKGIATPTLFEPCYEDGGLLDGPEAIIADRNVFSGSKYPGDPPHVFDLSTGQKLFDAKSDLWGLVSLSKNRHVIVAKTGAYASKKGGGFAITKHGKSDWFKAPFRAGMPWNTDPEEDLNPVALSPNGDWMAWESGDGVFSSVALKKPYRWHPSLKRPVPSTGPGQIWITDEGQLTVASEGYVLTRGRWTKAGRPDDHIFRLTSAFKPICNIIVCDIVSKRLGVVIRTVHPAKFHDFVHRADKTKLIAMSDDGRFLSTATQSEDPRYYDIDVVDLAADAKKVVPLEPSFELFETNDAQINAKDGCLILNRWVCYDVHSGHVKWTLRAAYDYSGIFIEFANGRIVFTPSLQRRIKLVKGFVSRDLDDAAADYFRRKH